MLPRPGHLHQLTSTCEPRHVTASPQNISNSASARFNLQHIHNMSSTSRSFLNYPPAREGPKVPYKYEDQVIPVFRGTPLVIGSTL